jgi:hypothetical protein
MWTIDEVPLMPGTCTVLAASTSQRIALSGATAVRIATGVVGALSDVTGGVWYKFGDSTVTATAGSTDEVYVPLHVVLDVPVPVNLGVTHLAIIEAESGVAGSVQVFK